MPKKDFPRDLRGLREPAAREIYIHRAVRKRFARIFFEEFEDGQKAGRTVAFRFSDVIYFLAVSASQGILGNVALRRAEGGRTPDS